MPVAELPGGFRMHYEDDDFTDPWTVNETVILHHGHGKNGRFWYAWVPLLARDYRVIRVDARGFGESSVPDAGYQWSLESFADDVIGLMDHLRLERAHIVGETLGGAIGLMTTHRYPHRVQTITACTSPFKFRGAQKYRDYSKEVEEDGAEQHYRRTVDLGDELRTKWYVEQMAKTSKAVIIGTLEKLSDVDITDLLPTIQTPALVMVGAADESRVERARRMAALLPNSRLVIIPGVKYAHYANPVKAVAAWREFVQSVRPAGSTG